LEEGDTNEECSTHGREEKFVQNFSRKICKTRSLIIPKRTWRIILKWMIECNLILSGFSHGGQVM
jgi:hypothetical protein